MITAFRFWLMSLCTVTIHISEVNDYGVKGLATCSGVYVAPKEVLTAGHCVEQTTGKMWIRTAEGKSFSATVLGVNKQEDLALLKVQGPKHWYIPIGAPVAQTDTVYSVSSQEEMAETYGEGVIRNVVIESESHTPMYLVSIAIRPGASGSGLFDYWGRLVGINTLGSTANSMAVHTTILKDFIERVQLRNSIKVTY